MAVGFNNRPTDRTKQIAALLEWNTEEVWRYCEDCSTQFRGTRRRMLCDDCRKERKRESDRQYEERRSGRRKEARRRARIQQSREAA